LFLEIKQGNLFSKKKWSVYYMLAYGLRHPPLTCPPYRGRSCPVWIEGFAYYILPSIQIDIGVRRARVWRRQKVMKSNILIYFDRLDTLNQLLRFIFVGRRGLAPLGGVETLINFVSKYNS